MAWGQPETAATVASASIAFCEAPDCRNQAFLNVVTPFGEPAKACLQHADGCVIVSVVEDAPFNEAVRDTLLATWETAKTTLEQAKNSEMEIRKAVFGYCFPAPKSGVNRMELSGGFALKATHKINTKVSGTIAEIEAVEEKCEKLGNEGAFLIERIIVWKADVSVSEIKKLDLTLPLHKQVKDLVDTIVTETPGAPTLEIEAPKAKLNG